MPKKYRYLAEKSILIHLENSITLTLKPSAFIQFICGCK